MTALHIAAANNDFDTAKALCLSPSININASNGMMTTPLLTAIKHKARGVAIHLLSIPTIDVDIKDENENTIFDIICDLIEN